MKNTSARQRLREEHGMLHLVKQLYKASGHDKYQSNEAEAYCGATEEYTDKPKTMVFDPARATCPTCKARKTRNTNEVFKRVYKILLERFGEPIGDNERKGAGVADERDLSEEKPCLAKPGMKKSKDPVVNEEDTQTCPHCNKPISSEEDWEQGKWKNVGEQGDVYEVPFCTCEYDKDYIDVTEAKVRRARNDKLLRHDDNHSCAACHGCWPCPENNSEFACDHCEGTGGTTKEPCPHCAGDGLNYERVQAAVRAYDKRQGETERAAEDYTDAMFDSTLRY